MILNKHFDKKAEGYVDSGVKILIAIVIGALILSGFYLLFSNTVMPTVNDKVESLFSYSEGTINNNTVDEGPKSYSVIAQDNYRYNQNMNITVDSDSDVFIKVEVDGKEVSSIGYDYTVDGTRTVVTLNSYVTSNLSKQDHTVMICFENGIAETSFFVG